MSHNTHCFLVWCLCAFVGWCARFTCVVLHSDHASFLCEHIQPVLASTGVVCDALAEFIHVLVLTASGKVTLMLETIAEVHLTLSFALPCCALRRLDSPSPLMTCVGLGWVGLGWIGMDTPGCGYLGAFAR